MSEELDLCLKRVTINSRNDMGVAHLQDFTIDTILTAWLDLHFLQWVLVQELPSLFGRSNLAEEIFVNPIMQKVASLIIFE